MIIPEFLLCGGGVVVGTTLTITGATPTGLPIAGATSFVSTVARLLPNEQCSKFKERYTKLRDWMKLISILYKKALTKSMID